jgi:hypothetical protein
MSDSLFELIRICIDSGEQEDARNLLDGVLHAAPHNVHAWELMAKLVDEPQKRADCYRQILRIDPEHPAALKALEEIDRAHAPSSQMQQVLDLLRLVGPAALDRETIERFKAIGVEISVVDGYISISSGTRNVKVHPSTLPGGRSYLYPEEIVSGAGDPLPSAERKECPYCRATIPLSATRCTWCSKELA